MAYDPMQYSLARANLAGNTAQGIGSAIVDFSAKIPEIIKMRDINERVNNAYKQAIETFVQTAKDSGVDETKARLGALRVIPQPIKDVDPKDNIKMLLDSSVKAESYLEKLKNEALTSTKSQAAQRAVAGEKTPVTGFTEDVGPVENQQLPASTQEEAMSRYGDLSARKEVPPQGAKELLDQPSIAALPKRPEPEKPMTEYQKAMLKLKDDANKIARLRTAKDNAGEFDKNLRYAQDRQDDISADEIRFSERLAKLRQARVKVKAGKKLSSEMLQVLSGEGMNAVAPDITELDNAINQYQDLLSQVEDMKAEADETVKGLIETKDLSKAIKRGKDKKEDIVFQREEKAIDYVRENIIPTISVFNSSVKTVLDRTPLEYKPVLEAKIEQARKYMNDDEILKMLSAPKANSVLSR